MKQIVIVVSVAKGGAYLKTSIILYLPFYGNDLPIAFIKA